MAAKLGGGTKKAMVDINITPFVDIVLVVLIIFMVTSSVVSQERIRVDLPDAASGDSETPPTSLALVVKADGTLYLDGAEISSDDIRRRLRQARQSSEDIVCLIGADASARHEQVVGLIDLVRQEGVARFALEVDPIPLPQAARQGLP
ncbi:MAG: biopolymer transporter ExbD [Myxococcota bacterium]